MAIARVSELYASAEEADAEMADVRAQMREHGEVNDLESVSLVSPLTATTNTLVRDLRKAMAESQQERAAQLLDKTPKHPDVVLIDTQIREYEAQLARALTEQHQMDPSVIELRVALAGLVQRKAQLSAAAESTIAEFARYPEKMREIAGLQLAADATENIYKSLLETQYQIAVAEAMTVADMKAVEPAKAPDKAAAPKLLVYLVLGCFVGVAVGVGLVFLAEYIDDSIKEQDEIREVWPLPVLGIVPFYRLSSKQTLIDQLAATDPLYEAFRNIRNGVRFAGVDQQINILAVTSCVPSEGKSTVMANLAICMAQDGQRVVIVDCDLRRPTQHRMFPTLSNEKGISGVLTGACSVDEAIQATPVENLSVLTSGPVPANPGRLVESLRLRQVLQGLAGKFDMVLVDAPPLLIVGDAVALSRAAKGLVIVVEAGKTPRRMIADLRARAEAAGVEPTGIVLNKVDVRSGMQAYYEQYAKHYKLDDPKKGRGKVA